MYDAAIGRFFKIDRYSDRYFSFSPYQYAGNNPIINIDVNGDWIYIMNGGVNYRYDNGAFQTMNKESGKYEKSDVSNDKFLSGLLQGLNDLKSNTNKGGEILGFFENDDNNVIITMNEQEDDGNNWGRIEDSGEIGLKPSLTGSIIPTEEGLQESPFWLDLGHELAHQMDFLSNGEKVLGIWVENPSEKDKPARETEKFATHMENIMRAQYGLPLRSHYMNEGKKGYEKSRILNSNGSSKFYTIVFPMGGGSIDTGIPIQMRKR
jgi:hypothetical protein